MPPGAVEIQQDRRRRGGAPPAKRGKTHGCTNRLAWLRAMDTNAFEVLMTSYVSPISVFRVVLRDVKHPALFLRRIREHLAYMWDRQDVVEISRFYVRFVARRDDYIAPSLLSINELLMPKHCAKIGGLALRANRTFEMGKTYSRVRLADATADNGVSAAARWTKARLWRELLRASPATTPRFKTYLAHHVVKGPCGSWCVVATKHVV
jgi:hypothetical protein